MRKRDQEKNHDSTDHIHQHENTTIVSRHKPEDQIKRDTSYIWPTLFYGAETWTITKSLLSRLDAFEMWVYRRVLKISWTEKITNEEVDGDRQRKGDTIQDQEITISRIYYKT